MFSLMEVISEECWNKQKIQHNTTVTSIPHDVNCCVQTTAGCRCGCPKVEQMLWVQTGTVRLCHLLPDTQDKKSYLVSAAGMNPRTKDLIL